MDIEERQDAIATLTAVLTDGALSGQVEMVLTRPEADRYRVVAVDGSVTFRRDDAGGRPAYTDTDVTGRNPIGEGSPERFVGLGSEQDQRFPGREANSYPHARDSIAQFFDAEHAPDLVVTHTSSHHFDHHLGQHGSLGITQARAPFIIAGPGVRAEGIVERSSRTINIAPTIATLLGLDPHPGGVGPTGVRRSDALLRRQDGDPETDVLTGDRAEHVVVFLLDGCNANLLADVVESGEAPNIAAIAARGTTYRHGLMASLPTATLANHTAEVTGAHPGHSGILHNTWFNRHVGDAPDLLAMDQMFHAMGHLDPSVETIWQAIERSRPGAFTTATFEFCDTGASFSSFALLRDGIIPSSPDLATLPHLDRDAAAGSDQYRFMSTIDHTSAAQTIAAWHRTGGNPLPTLSWCALALTDEAGHESGPHGEAARAAVRDSDGRIGDVLAAVDAAGVLDRTAVLVIADHGMEQNDPTNTRSWSGALASTGIAHHDVGDGLIYIL